MSQRSVARKENRIFDLHNTFTRARCAHTHTTSTILILDSKNYTAIELLHNNDISVFLFCNIIAQKISIGDYVCICNRYRHIKIQKKKKTEIQVQGEKHNKF